MYCWTLFNEGFGNHALVLIRPLELSEVVWEFRVNARQKGRSFGSLKGLLPSFIKGDVDPGMSLFY